MFKLQSNPTFTHEVKVMMPVDGGHEPQIFKARFKLLDADDMASHVTSTPEGSEAFLRAVIVGLEDIIGDDDEVIPYSDNLRDQVIASLPARGALLETYMSACAKTRVGN